MHRSVPIINNVFNIYFRIIYTHVCIYGMLFHQVTSTSLHNALTTGYTIMLANLTESSVFVPVTVTLVHFNIR